MKHIKSHWSVVLLSLSIYREWCVEAATGLWAGWGVGGPFFSPFPLAPLPPFPLSLFPFLPPSCGMTEGGRGRGRRKEKGDGRGEGGRRREELREVELWPTPLSIYLLLIQNIYHVWRCTSPFLRHYVRVSTALPEDDYKNTTSGTTHWRLFILYCIFFWLYVQDNRANCYVSQPWTTTLTTFPAAHVLEPFITYYVGGRWRKKKDHNSFQRLQRSTSDGATQRGHSTRDVTPHMHTHTRPSPTSYCNVLTNTGFDEREREK